MSRPRVLLAEDNPVMAAELRALLEPELEVVATVADGAALVTAADMARPDVIVTDIVMPHRSGIDATVEVLRRHPRLGSFSSRSMTTRPSSSAGGPQAPWATS